MPDHLHFVCSLDNSKPINAGARGVVPEGVLDHVARFKSFTTRESWKVGLSGKLWQRSSFDRVLSHAHQIDEVIEYVLNNPVRKGLVQRWEDWPYSRIVDPWT
jgi:REP element-mobilizing transposase RayT